MLENQPAAMKAKLVQRDAQALADGYTPLQRRLNIAGTVAFFGYSTLLAATLFQATSGAEWFLVAGIALLAVIGADFGSGLVHWGADTWGTADWPIVGRMFIRSFREHHVVQTKICEHGWVQANGEACYLACILMLPHWFLAPTAGGSLVWLSIWALTFAMMVLLVFTNEFHKWAHMKHAPAPIKFAQNIGLLQSYKRHAYHHAAPFTRAYCITTGWLNPFLDAVGFWRWAERTVARLTGWIPREDDIGREAALLLWNEQNSGRNGFPVLDQTGVDNASA